MCGERSAINGTAVSTDKPLHKRTPYESVGDFLSNTSNFKIIESTLREGEQFANAFFDTGEPPIVSLRPLRPLRSHAAK